jgi:hypothetical protein
MIEKTNHVEIEPVQSWKQTFIKYINAIFIIYHLLLEVCFKIKYSN